MGSGYRISYCVLLGISTCCQIISVALIGAHWNESEAESAFIDSLGVDPSYRSITFESLNAALVPLYLLMFLFYAIPMEFTTLYTTKKGTEVTFFAFWVLFVDLSVTGLIIAAHV